MSKLKMCNCGFCKAGRKSGRNRYMIQHAKSAHRSAVKRMLSQGRYDNIPAVIRIVYTG